MATAARCLTRGVLRAIPRTPFNPATTRPAARLAVPRQAFRQQTRRGYASEAPKSGGSGGLIGGLAVLALAGAGYWYYTTNPDAFSGLTGSGSGKKGGVFTPKFEDYQKVYDAVAKALEEHSDYDDGSYGPVLLRLGWHASGT